MFMKGFWVPRVERGFDLTDRWAFCLRRIFLVAVAEANTTSGSMPRRVLMLLKKSCLAWFVACIPRTLSRSQTLRLLQYSVKGDLMAKKALDEMLGCHTVCYPLFGTEKSWLCLCQSHCSAARSGRYVIPSLRHEPQPNEDLLSAGIGAFVGRNSYHRDEDGMAAGLATSCRRAYCTCSQTRYGDIRSASPYLS